MQTGIIILLSRQVQYSTDQIQRDKTIAQVLIYAIIRTLNKRGVRSFTCVGALI